MKKQHGNTGRPRSEEHKRKLAEAHRGRKLSEETRRKISQSNRGRKLSEEHRRKISESKRGANNPLFGKKVPDETKAKKSRSMWNNASQKMYSIDPERIFALASGYIFPADETEERIFEERFSPQKPHTMLRLEKTLALYSSDWNEYALRLAFFYAIDVVRGLAYAEDKGVRKKKHGFSGSNLTNEHPEILTKRDGSRYSGKHRAYWPISQFEEWKEANSDFFEREIND